MYQKEREIFLLPLLKHIVNDCEHRSDDAPVTYQGEGEEQSKSCNSYQPPHPIDQVDDDQARKQCEENIQL